MNILLVCSSGGHLQHLMMLKDFWAKHERTWVTFDKADARSLLADEKMIPCHYPTNRNFLNLAKNTILALNVLFKNKFDLIISSGAAVAIPFFYIGKIMGIKTIYIEVFDRIDSGTLTGKIVYPVSDRFIVQWPEQLSVYPNAINLGSIF